MMQNPCIFKGSLILEGVFILVNVQNFEFEPGDVHKISFPARFHAMPIYLY